MERETLGIALEGAAQWAARFSRDKNRTPMQWTAAAKAGFSLPGVGTWLPVNPNYAQGVNVASQPADPDSLLSFYRPLLRVRKRTPALVAGDYTPLHEHSPDYLVLLRSVSPQARLRSVSPQARLRSVSPQARLRSSDADRQTCLVVLNLSAKGHALNFDLGAETSRLVFSSHKRANERADLARIPLAPFEIYSAELRPEASEGTPTLLA